MKSTCLYVFLLFVCLMVFLSACGLTEADKDKTELSTDILTYSPVRASMGAPIAEVLPNWSSQEQVVSYKVKPDLPDGLVLNSETGGISGIPAAVMQSGEYTITATGGEDYSTSVTAIVTIEVFASTDISGYQLNYSPADSYYTDTPIINITPSWSPRVPLANYEISPRLPESLGIDAITGVISGAAPSTALDEEYVITADAIGDYVGGTTARLRLVIVAHEDIGAYTRSRSALTGFVNPPVQR